MPNDDRVYVPLSFEYLMSLLFGENKYMESRVNVDNRACAMICTP